MWKYCTAAIVAVLGVVPLSAMQQSDDSAATLVFQKSYDVGVGFGTGTRQQFFIVDNRNCNKKKRVAAFSWITGQEKAISVPANNAITIWAFTAHINFGRETLCQNAFTFSPQGGRRYAMQLKSSVNTGCRVIVTDQMTNSTPSDLTYDNELLCKRLEHPDPIVKSQ